MCPQLFINYKMKSVAHLPWRQMTYKFLNTIVDDLFAFVIKMPTLHRLSVFRDGELFACTPSALPCCYPASCLCLTGASIAIGECCNLTVQDVVDDCCKRQGRGINPKCVAWCLWYCLCFCVFRCRVPVPPLPALDLPCRQGARQ